MKTILLLPFVLALPVFAGTSAKEVVAPAPASNPCLFTWFAGGSVGYLTELEEVMYTGHIGTDTCWNIGGWNVAMFAEIGYTEKDESYTYQRSTASAPKSVASLHDSFDLNELEDYLASQSFFGTSGYDLEVMPITFNVKLERQLTGNLNAYFGGGIGLANVDLSIHAGNNHASDDDWVFVGQVFAGLSYNVNQNFEIFGGARWIYFDDADLSDNGFSGTLELDDDFLFELGARFNF